MIFPGVWFGIFILCLILFNCTQSELRDKKEIKLFRLGKDADDFCIVFTDNYTKQLREQFTTHSALIGRFIDTVVMETTEVTLNKSKMEEFGFTDQDIT